jgi:hypothetical protein
MRRAAQSQKKDGFTDRDSTVIRFAAEAYDTR